MTTPTHLNSLQRASRLGSLHEKTQETRRLQREAHNSHDRNTVQFHYTGFHIVLLVKTCLKIRHICGKSMTKNLENRVVHNVQLWERCFHPFINF